MAKIYDFFNPDGDPDSNGKIALVTSGALLQWIHEKPQGEPIRCIIDIISNELDIGEIPVEYHSACKYVIQVLTDSQKEK